MPGSDGYTNIIERYDFPLACPFPVLACIMSSVTKSIRDATHHKEAIAHKMRSSQKQSKPRRAIINPQRGGVVREGFFPKKLSSFEKCFFYEEKYRSGVENQNTTHPSKKGASLICGWREGGGVARKCSDSYDRASCICPNKVFSTSIDSSRPQLRESII